MGLTENPAALLLDPSFPYGEDLLQFIWERQLFDRHGLRTTDGRPVEVLRPGRIQRDSGPDLVDAQVRIDGQHWAGTVEVHVRASEWRAHGHQHDPAYESVILHAVYVDDGVATTVSGRAVPAVELISRIAAERIVLYRSLMRAPGAVPCAPHMGAVGQARIGAWLDRVLVQRLERKTGSVLRLVQERGGDPEDALYQLLARAFGMKVNETPFGMLAQALPLKALLKHRDDALRMEALVFGQAGLLQVDFVDEHPRRLQAEHRVLAALHGLKPMPVAAWKHGRMRPANLPTVRLAQFAQLMARCGDGLTGLLALDDLSELRKLLQVSAAGYWDDHFVFDRVAPGSPKRIGRGFADHLIINAVVPGLFAYGRLTGRQDPVDRGLALLEQMPAERNCAIAAWASVGVHAANAARGQALLELGKAYCAPRRCLLCGIGNHILGDAVK